MLIMASLYTANTSANLTTQQIRSIIHSREDLKEKTVVAWSQYTDTLREYGIHAYGMPWVSECKGQLSCVCHSPSQSCIHYPSRVRGLNKGVGSVNVEYNPICVHGMSMAAKPRFHQLRGL